MASARYKVLAETWTTEKHTVHQELAYELQCADIVDTRNGQRFNDGAWRVQINKRSVKGKGGTSPFLGETAWSRGEMLYADLVTQARFAR